MIFIIPIICNEKKIIINPATTLSSLEFFKTNSIIIALISVVGILLQISLIGGLWVSYMALDSQQDISPINALQAGLLKFFPLFGAYIIVNIASAFGFLLLILPGIYLTARFSLFAAHIMLSLIHI